MSKRLRLEVQRAEAEALKEKIEEERQKAERDKLTGPIRWRKFGPEGHEIVIEDCQEKSYGPAVDVVMDYFTSEDVLFREADFALDEDSMTCLRERVLFYLKNWTSAVAVDDEPEESVVCGVMVLQVVHMNDFCRTFSRSMLRNGEAMEKISKLINTLNREVDIYAHYDCLSFLRIYYIAVIPEYRHRGIGKQFLKASLDIGRHLRCKAVVGIFSGYALQIPAKKMGMEILNEIYYVDWRDQYGEMIFNDPGPGNYTVSLMGMRVPKDRIEEEVAKKVVEAPKEEPRKHKLTRAEKRAEKAAKKNPE